MTNISEVIKDILDSLSKKASGNLKYRRLIIYSIKLAFCFEFLYGSMVADKDSFFFDEGKIEEIKILNKHLEVISPFNLEKHLK